MFLSIKLRDTLPLMVSALLIAAAFLLPPYEAGGEIAVFAPDGPVLIIDPGHGGADGGAQAADGSVESALNLSVAKKLNALAGLFGVETVMTRESEDIAYPDGADSIAGMKRADQHARAELIASVPDGVLISIHQNYYPDERPSGAVVLYAAAEGSRELGEAAQSLLVEKLDSSNRRVAAPVDDEVYLMRSAECPAILVECGFMSNPAELEKLKSGSYQFKIAAVLLSAYLQRGGAVNGMVI